MENNTNLLCLVNVLQDSEFYNVSKYDYYKISSFISKLSNNDIKINERCFNDIKVPIYFEISLKYGYNDFLDLDVDELNEFINYFEKLEYSSSFYFIFNTIEMFKSPANKCIITIENKKKLFKEFYENKTSQLLYVGCENKTYNEISTSFIKNNDLNIEIILKFWTIYIKNM